MSGSRDLTYETRAILDVLAYYNCAWMRLDELLVAVPAFFGRVSHDKLRRAFRELQVGNRVQVWNPGSRGNRVRVCESGRPERPFSYEDVEERKRPERPLSEVVHVTWPKED